MLTAAVVMDVVAPSVTPELVGPPPVVEAAATTTAFVPGTPCRLADVRDGTGFERVDPQTVRVIAAGRCGVPLDAVAVALTVTVDNTGWPDPGYVTVWPEGSPFPKASIINYRSGQIRANGTIVTIGAGGAIDLFAQNRAPVIVDVTGWFRQADAVAAGRFVPITPTRALDTRQPPRSRPLAPGETVNVALPTEVPSDAGAVALTITLTESPAAGYFTVAPAGTPKPPTSVLNSDGRGQTRAAGSIVGVTSAGIDVFSLSGGHVIVDITGWFTGTSAAVDDDGMFVPEAAPRRLLDTRTGDPVWPGGGVEIANVTGNAAALALNVTIVEPIQPGFLTAHAARQPRPPTSTVNGTSQTDIAASSAIVPTSLAGVGVYSNAGADVVIDLAGWFVGTPGPAPEPPPVNVRPPSCTSSSDAGGLNSLFQSGVLFTGADYQRVFPLPDGRQLWLFQDVFIRGRYGGSTFAHNAGLVQSGSCFTLLQTGTFADPGEYLFRDVTQRRRHWFWPLGGDVGTDGRFHVWVAEMRENGSSYLTQTEPIATWIVTIDLATMKVVDRRPATDPSPSLYGWSVASNADYTYLYAHCHRQFGWDPFPFVSPPVYVHDWDCVDEVKVARVPRGQFEQPLAYWNGSTWVANAAQATSVVPAGRLVSASQMYWTDGKWISITKVGDWFGDRIEIDVASQPQGPFTTVRTITTPQRCATCNTYFPSLLPYRASDGAMLIGISNNVFGPLDLSRYDPTFFTTPAI